MGIFEDNKINVVVYEKYQEGDNDRYKIIYNNFECLVQGNRTDRIFSYADRSNELRLAIYTKKEIGVNVDKYYIYIKEKERVFKIENKEDYLINRRSRLNYVKYNLVEDLQVTNILY